MACDARQDLEVTCAVDNHRQTHSCQFVDIHDTGLTVTVPDTLHHLRDLLWALPVEGMFRVQHGWAYFQAMVQPDTSSSETIHLKLTMPGQLKLMLTPGFLVDAVTVPDGLEAVFHFRTGANGESINHDWKLQSVSPKGAACIAPKSAQTKVGQFGMLWFVTDAYSRKILLRSTVQHAVEIDDRHMLVLLEFERASRYQVHRDSLERVEQLIARWWQSVGQPEPSKTTAPVQRLADAAPDVRQVLAEPFSTHAPATISTETETFASRLLLLESDTLLMQAPPDDDARRLSPGTPVRISLTRHHTWITLETAIQSRSSVQLRGVGRLDALVATMPETCQISRRRTSLRTQVAIWPAVHVLVQPRHRYGETSKGPRKPNAILLNISGGGARVQAVAGNHRSWDLEQASVDQIVSICLQLHEHADPIVLSAQVRNQSRDLDTGRTVLGLQFLHMEDSVAGRIAKRQIDQFAARMQRQQIQRQRELQSRSALA